MSSSMRSNGSTHRSQRWKKNALSSIPAARCSRRLSRCRMWKTKSSARRCMRWIGRSISCRANIPGRWTRAPVWSGARSSWMKSASMRWSMPMPKSAPESCAACWRKRSSNMKTAGSERRTWTPRWRWRVSRSLRWKKKPAARGWSWKARRSCISAC